MENIQSAENSFLPRAEHCPVCASSALIPQADIPSNQYYMFDRNLYHIDRCGGCELLFINPMPSNTFLRRHYTQAFNHDTLFMPRRKDQDQKLIDEIIATMGDRPRAGIKYYEIGIGAGHFSHHVHQNGLDVRGCELSGGMAAKQHPFPVDDGLFQEFGYADAFDIVSSSHVLEHANDPVAVVRAIHKSLKPGGVAAIRVPNAEGSYYRLASLLLGPHKWDTFLPVPDHLTIFTAKGFGELFQRNGFQVEQLRTLPYVNNESNILVAYMALTAKAFILRVLPLLGKKVTTASEYIKNEENQFNTLGRSIIRLSNFLRPLETLFMFFAWPLYRRLGMGEDLFIVARKPLGTE